MTAPYPVDAALHHVTVTASDRQVLPVDDAPTGDSHDQHVQADLDSFDKSCSADTERRYES